MTTDPPSQILLCGKGRIATAALSYTVHHVALQGLGCRVTACPNADDKGYDTWQESLAKAAALLGVKLVTTESAEQIPDLLLISLEYDRIIRVARFASRRLYNLHFSALPQYRGVFTSIWPLLNRETHVGVSLHIMDSGVDTGNLIDRRMIALPRYTTARQLYESYLDEGLTLFREWLPRLLTSAPPGSPQDEHTATAYNRQSLDMRQTEVSFDQPGESVCAFVRAFSFPEYQRPTVRGRGVRASSLLPGTTAAAPGTVLHETAFSTSFAANDARIVEIIWA